ncbi:anthranilate synthase family protein [Kibdelosporangium phytohabitans]|uniref:anthranilate synthase n=1 Tax=Kibdelosporangium phytohabitans TaxID=860235 RepID=A0A0N9I1L2_9PSEU|nr:anthranilate synthase family protein [Kibdelosporangium phytohabitans]ALG08568.1 anthranilate synthase [Kibdelosporangium phytohabitans]MBE1470353.1 phenazine biosynthesis protein phzE [Kibdelosporangium phytohabitans]
MTEGIRDLLGSLLADGAPPFALLCRSTVDERRVELLTGDVAEFAALAGLPLPGPEVAAVLAAIPFRQITERGYDCNDDNERILALSARERVTMPVDEALRELPDVAVTLTGARFDLEDDEYGRVVSRILDDEIRTGEGSNFVIKRSFLATLEQYRPEVAMTIFRRLLTMESNAYWTFVVHTGDRTFVGASPEQHVEVTGGVARMNPISGTYPYPAEGVRLSGLLEFLADGKETGELFMVVDEELKMLARVCDHGARVQGPYLREMARLAHTEYVLEGASSLDVRDVLRETLFAPTIIGSPLENACRVIARYEPSGRGYYGGALALLERDDTGEISLDSAILIRTADIRPTGELRIDVGATLVRDSRPEGEVAETWAKVDALLAATGLDHSRRGTRPATAVARPLADEPEVISALERRNATLSSFWLAKPADIDSAVPVVGRVVIVDGEDMFTGMLGHQLRSAGLDFTIRSWDSVRPADIEAYDQVVLGPGPGDPRAAGDPKVARLRELVAHLLDRDIPFVAECLSHQVLCDLLGLGLFRRQRPNQGVQRDIDLFGRVEPVGFYNSYAARHDADLLESPLARGVVEVCRDEHTGEVHALRAARFASTQFHLESVLTQRGADLLAELMAWTARPAAGASRR